MRVQCTELGDARKLGCELEKLGWVKREFSVQSYETCHHWSHQLRLDRNLAEEFSVRSYDHPVNGAFLGPEWVHLDEFNVRS